jgi:hypothetical protein
MLITVKYCGPTNSRGSRFIVSNGLEKKTFPFSYAANHAEEQALRDFCKHYIIDKTFLYGGYIRETHFFVSNDSAQVK